MSVLGSVLGSGVPRSIAPLLGAVFALLAYGEEGAVKYVHVAGHVMRTDGGTIAGAFARTR
jgi:hypothetical protein